MQRWHLVANVAQQSVSETEWAKYLVHDAAMRGPSICRVCRICLHASRSNQFGDILASGIVGIHII